MVSFDVSSRDLDSFVCANKSSSPLSIKRKEQRTIVEQSIDTIFDTIG